MQIVSAQRFKVLHTMPGGSLRRRSPAIELGVRKDATEPVVKLDDRTLRFTITTGIVDRDQDRIAVNGWDFTAYERNPVVLWSHRADELPIGKTLDLPRSEDRISAVVRFLPEQGYGSASEFADTVYRLARDDFLFATSVGFRPLKWEFSEDKDRDGGGWFPGIDFNEQELVELSIVAVPANIEALIEPALVTELDPIEGAQAAEHEARARRRRRLQAEIMGLR